MFRLNPKQLKNINRVFSFEHRTNCLTASSFNVLKKKKNKPELRVIFKYSQCVVITVSGNISATAI